MSWRIKTRLWKMAEERYCYAISDRNMALYIFHDRAVGIWYPASPDAIDTVSDQAWGFLSPVRTGCGHCLCAAVQPFRKSRDGGESFACGGMREYFVL